MRLAVRMNGIVLCCLIFGSLASGCLTANRYQTTADPMLRPTHGIGKPASDELSTEAVVHAHLPDGALYADRPFEPAQAPTRQTREVLGYYTETEGVYPGSADTFSAQHEQISAIAPFWYRLDEKRPGYVVSTVPSEQRKQVIAEAHRSHAHVYLLVHNLFYDTLTKGKDAARRILRNPKTRVRFINHLVREVKTYGFDGVNLDIENLHPSDRYAFSQLVKQLGQRLHSEDKLLTVSVPANSGDERANPWSHWFDYRTLGRWADRIVLMTYDEHNPRTKPGPVASYDWTESTVRYALSQKVPPEKILIGTAGYGWNWNESDGKAKYASYTDIRSFLQKYDAQPVWDERTRSPHFSYRDEAGFLHHVWYENSQSLKAKLQLVETYNLQGIAIWRLGLEDPEIWQVISNHIRVRKFD
ncbi:MAG: glycoside hydrolase family 18 [Brevibacillus sp.]|nr:glycoside hydrolase family 18 [Brevibacillus sp.]